MDICSEEFFRKDTKVTGFTQNKYINPRLKFVDKIQSDNNVKGNVGEIGVHHGKSFIPLTCLAREDERAIAIDCFHDQKFNVDKSGKGSLEHLKENCKLFGTWEKEDIISGKTVEISTYRWNQNGFSNFQYRWISYKRSNLH